MTVIHSVRLVAVTDPAPQGPVDVEITDGVVTSVTPAADPSVDNGWLMPGLWDQHVHLGQWAMTSARLDLAPATSVAAAVRRVRARLDEQPDRPVIGWGHRPTGWDAAPTVAALDAIDTEQPIVLICGDGHHGWLNTPGLRLLDLPPRDGVVAEAEWFAAYGRLAALGLEGGSDTYRSSMQTAAALGVVGLVDFEFSGGASQWLERWGAGSDLLRIRMASYADGLADVEARGLRTGDPLGSDPTLTMGPLKIISDGSLNTRTAWCCDPYAEKAVPGFPFGQPNQSPEELHDLLARAGEQGLDVAVHAIGDRAVSEALAAFADTGARGGIEHAQLTTLEDVRRMADLGVRASVQPAHLLDDREVSEQLWPGRGHRCFALRWMVDEGVDVVLGSDAPVSPLDPWLAMSAAVGRGAEGGAEDDPWHPEQAITAREALAASTDGWGTVAVGHPGDLVLIDVDPLAGALPLRSMAGYVRRTWVAGEIVWNLSDEV